MSVAIADTVPWRIVLPVDTRQLGDQSEFRDDGTAVFSGGTACDPLCREALQRRQWSGPVAMLARSDQLSDRLAAATMASGAPHLGTDADELFRSLVQDHPDNATVIFNARRHCFFNPGGAWCDAAALDARARSVAPRNLAILLPALAERYNTGDMDAVARLIDEMAQRVYTTSYYGENIGVFLEVLERHPDVFRAACHEPACDEWVSPALLAKFMNAMHFRPELNPLTPLVAAATERGLGQEVLGIARHLQNQKDNLHHAAVGRGIERQLLWQFGDPDSRLPKIQAQEDYLNQLSRAMGRWNLRFDAGFDAQRSTEIVELIIQYGEIASMEMRLEQAGLELDKLPQDCLSPDRQERMADLARALGETLPRTDWSCEERL